jgi:hypothetical protein
MKTAVLVLACLFLVTGTAALHYAGRIAAARYGPEVAARRLEIQDWLKPRYDQKWLARFVANSPEQAGGYASPVLFPLDAGFALVIAALFGLLSAIAAGLLGKSPGMIGLFVIVPLAFLLCDLTEDLLLERLLSKAQPVTERAVTIVQAVTSVRLVTFILATAQVVVVWLWVLLGWWRGKLAPL